MQARAPKLGEARAGGRSPYRSVRSLEIDSQGADEVLDLIGALGLEFVGARAVRWQRERSAGVDGWGPGEGNPTR